MLLLLEEAKRLLQRATQAEAEADEVSTIRGSQIQFTNNESVQKKQKKGEDRRYVCLNYISVPYP